jgi:hypothetical protein
MKRNIILSVLMLFSIISFSQTFEGEIVYLNTYKSKNTQFTDERWAMLLGNVQNYLIKAGDYKSITNGKLMQWQLYINKDNKLYNKMANSETVFWNDGSVQGDVIIKVEVNKNVTEVLGDKCDEIILTCKSGIQKYYYNSKLAVDTKLFINHKYANWYDFLSKSNSLPLKMILENPQFTTISIATEIKPMKLEINTFELPAGVKTEKSKY